jgi:hypothetical protein
VRAFLGVKHGLNKLRYFFLRHLVKTKSGPGLAPFLFSDPRFGRQKLLNFTL